MTVTFTSAQYTKYIALGLSQACSSYHVQVLRALEHYIFY